MKSDTNAKLAVFSDSHGQTGLMERAFAKISKHISAAVHLGDNAADAFVLARACALTPFYLVSGNCDPFRARALINNKDNRDIQDELVFEISGVKLFITHGHRYSVKRGYDGLMAKAASLGARVCMFGHTHEPELFRHNGCLFVNPGSISLPRGGLGPSYAILDIYGPGAGADIAEASVEASIIERVNGVFRILCSL